MAPNVAGTIVAHAFDLVYLDAARFLIRVPSADGALHFRRKSEGGPSFTQLANAVRTTYGSIEARAEGDEIVVRSSDGKVPDPVSIVLDMGPFEQESYAPGQLVLRRRSGVGVAKIEFIDVGTEDEEWRRFLAREVDLVPSVRASYRPYLAEVPSVRLVNVSEQPTMGLLFHVAKGPFADRRLRQALSLAVRRRAIARVVLGTQEGAATASEDPAEARRNLTEIRRDAGEPAPVRISFVAGDDQRAALVLEQQLAEVGLRVTLDPVSTDAANEMLNAGSFAVFLMYAGWTPIYFDRAVTHSRRNKTDYSNAEFDRAVAEGNNAAAVEILEHDVPMTPLYTSPEAVALDRRFCGAHPKVTWDLSWLADVHTCAQGETE